MEKANAVLYGFLFYGRGIFFYFCAFIRSPEILFTGFYLISGDMKNCVSVLALVCSAFVFHPTSGQTVKPSPEEYLATLLNPAIPFDTTATNETVTLVDSLTAWKEWKTVGNFHYGKDRGSLPMITDLDALHPYFRDKVVELIKVCEAAGITLAIVESYRTPAKQAQYYAMGNQYTNTAGGHSRHQYGLAVDVVPIVDSVAVWNNSRLWRKIGHAGERLGLRWGGRWRVTYDPGHFEWSGGLSRKDLSHGQLPNIPSTLADRYPSFDNELKRLQAYWKAWEIEQSVYANKAGKPGAESSIGVGQ